MKKFLALALASVMAVSLVACGSTNADTNAESSAAATTTATTAESSSEEPGLKIAIVSSPSGVDDGSFNQDNYNGVLKFIEENPNATVTPIREETGDSAAAVQAVADVVADYDVIVCCGFQFAGIGNLAQENPDTKFILIDSWPTVDGTEVTADQVIDNVYVVDHLICGYFGTINGRPGIDQDELGIRILLCQIADTCKLETTAYNNIIISYNISYSLNSCCAVTGLFTDGGYGCIRILLNELQNTVVVVLIEGTVIHAGGAGYDSDLQTGFFTAALCSCCSGGSCRTGFCIGVSIGAAACYQRNSHDRCKCKCQKLFHNFFLLKM